MNDRTRLILIRHGETEWNKNLRFQGHRDIPLSEEGREQARKIARRLSTEKVDAAYASDLSRALETAEIIAEYHNLEVKVIPDLKEMNFGQWEGLTHGEIDSQFPESMATWLKDPLKSKIPGGESMNDVALRCQTGMSGILADNPYKNALVVAHGGIIRIIIAQALGIELKHYWKFRMDNVSLSIIDYYDNGRAIVNVLNDTSHLVYTCIEK